MQLSYRSQSQIEGWRIHLFILQTLSSLRLFIAWSLVYLLCIWFDHLNNFPYLSNILMSPSLHRSSQCVSHSLSSLRLFLSLLHQRERSRQQTVMEQQRLQSRLLLLSFYFILPKYILSDRLCAQRRAIDETKKYLLNSFSISRTNSRYFRWIHEQKQLRLNSPIPLARVSPIARMRADTRIFPRRSIDLSID